MNRIEEIGLSSSLLETTLIEIKTFFFVAKKNSSLFPKLHFQLLQSL